MSDAMSGDTINGVPGRRYRLTAGGWVNERHPSAAAIIRELLDTVRRAQREPDDARVAARQRRRIQAAVARAERWLADEARQR